MLFCNLQMISLIFFHFDTILSGELQPAHLGKGAWLEWTMDLSQQGEEEGGKHRTLWNRDTEGAPVSGHRQRRGLGSICGEPKQVALPALRARGAVRKDRCETPFRAMRLPLQTSFPPSKPQMITSFPRNQIGQRVVPVHMLICK